MAQLLCLGLGTDPCANIANAPGGDCRAKFQWSWKRSLANLAPQSCWAERQRRRAGRVLGVAHQLRLAHQCRIRQLVKARDWRRHALHRHLGRACQSLLLAALGGLLFFALFTAMQLDFYRWAVALLCALLAVATAVYTAVWCKAYLK